MATQSAQFEPVAWWWARNQIGRDLRELYEVPKELPPKLLALVSKFTAYDRALCKCRLLGSISYRRSFPDRRGYGYHQQ